MHPTMIGLRSQGVRSRAKLSRIVLMMQSGKNAARGTFPNLISSVAFQRDFRNTVSRCVAKMRISSVSRSAIGIASGCRFWMRMGGRVLGEHLLQLQGTRRVTRGFEAQFSQ